MMMSPGLRKVTLTAHVTSSIGWFGAVAAFLALALVGMGSTDPELVRAAYLMMGVMAWFVIVPFAFVSLGSGVVSSLLTKWGLLRHYWVLLKLLITSGATFLLIVHTQPIGRLSNIAAKTIVLGVYPRGTQIQMVATSAATLVMLVMLTGLAIYKPRGMTPYGQRKQDEQRKQVTALDTETERTQEIMQEDEDNDVHSATLN